MTLRQEVVIALGILLLLLIFALNKSATHLNQSVQGSGILVGAYTEFHDSNTEYQDFTQLEGELGKPLVIQDMYDKWADDLATADSVPDDVAHGIIPDISWAPTTGDGDPNSDSGPCTSVTATDIIAGKYDAQLRQQADELRDLNVPVIIRWFAEMNYSKLDKNCFYTADPGGNASIAGPEYVAAWKHLVDLFRAEGATNVKWAWIPGDALTLTKEVNGKSLWQWYYPGNDYVDFVGTDTYDKDAGSGATFATSPNFTNFYQAVEAATGKPYMLGETAAVADASRTPEPQTEWINSMQDFETRFPAVKIIIYWDSIGKYGTSNYPYLLKSNTSGFAAFQNLLSNPYFEMRAL